MKHLIFWVGLMTPSLAWSSGYSLHAQGSHAGGMAHTGVTLSDSGEAAWWNPAQLTDGQGLRIIAGGTGATARMTATALPDAQDTPWSSQTIPSFAVAPYVYGSYAHENWAIGFTTNLPHVSRIRWPDDWPQRFESLESAPQFFRTTLFSSIRFGSVSFSIGPSLDIGQVYTKRATNHIVEEGQVQLSLRGYGVGLHLAAALELNESWNVGLRYHSRSRVRTAGEIDFDVPLAFSADYPDQTAHADWTLPDHLNLGARWTHQRWSIAIEWGVTVWSVQDTVIVSLEQTEPIELQYNWRTSATAKLGVSMQVMPKLSVQTGGYLDGIPTAVPAETLGPSSPDGTRIGATAGVHWRVHSALGIAAHYEGIGWLKRASQSSDAPLAEYSGEAHMFGLSAEVRIP